MKKFYLSILTILLAVAASAQTATNMSLGGIVLNGTKGEFYTITNKLYGVYVPPRYKNVVFARDNNNNVNKSDPADYPSDKIYDNVADFDQSNWIQILFPEGTDASGFAGKEIPNHTITGRVNVVSTIPQGPVGLYIEASPDIDSTSYSSSSFNGNLYNCANFVQQEWFFVKPKNLEYCNIHWAVYNGDNMFYVPKASDFPGSFKVNMALWEQQTDDNSVTAGDVFQPGYAYEFPAIIQFSVDYQVGLNIDPGFDGDFNYGMPGLKNFEVGQAGTLPEGYRNVVVYPLRITQEVITAIDVVDATRGEAESEQYYDLQGRMSTTPLKGVNIKVTTYTDGSTSREKVLHN